MAYLIAKRTDTVGCYALEMKHGKELAEFSHELSEKAFEEKVRELT